MDIYPVANWARRANVAKFGANHVRYDHLTKQSGQKIDFTNDHEIAKWTGVSYDDGHDASKAKLVEHPPFAFQVRQRVGFEDLMLLEKTIDLMTGLETQQAA